MLAKKVSLSDVTFAELTVATLHGVDELEALADAWNRLAGPTAEPMFAHAWSLAAARTLHRDAQLYIVTVRRGAALAAVAPLVEVARGGVRWLEVLGARFLGEPAGFLSDAPDSRERLCRALIAQRKPVLLQRLDRGVYSTSLRAAARGRAFVAVMPARGCLRVDFTGDWAGYTSRLSASRAATLRRKRRQLEKYGRLAFDLQVPVPGDVDAILRAAFEVEQRSWKGEAGSAVLQRPALFAFFRDLGRTYAADGRLAVRRLQVGAEVAATHVGVFQANRWWELKIGYDAQWSRSSPGVLLTWEALQDGFRRELRSHEFLGSAASWQEPFATSERALEIVVVYPLSAAGLFALGIDAAAFAARRARRLATGAVGVAARRAQPLVQALKQRIAASRDRWFDWRHGVETGARVAVAELTDLDERLARHAVHYEATSIPKFERALRLLGPRVAGFTFIDLGSGKGRVLMLAARHPFRRIVGVELSASLHATARANVAAFTARHGNSPSIECVCADASAHDLPEGDLVVFLYNPFDATLLALARDRMLAACEREPRKLAVVYINPLHHSIFEQDEKFSCAHRDASLAVYWHCTDSGAAP